MLEVRFLSVFATTPPAAESMPTAAGGVEGRALRSPEADGDLLERVHRLLHAALHARLDDRIPHDLARTHDERREERPTIVLRERRRVQRRIVLGRARSALEQLGRDQSLVRND